MNAELHLDRWPHLRRLGAHLIMLVACTAAIWVMLTENLFVEAPRVLSFLTVMLLYLGPLTYLYWIIDRGVRILFGPSGFRGLLRILLVFGFVTVFKAIPVLVIALVYLVRHLRELRQSAIQDMHVRVAESYMAIRDIVERKGYDTGGPGRSARNEPQHRIER